MYSYMMMSFVEERRSQLAADAARPRWERGGRRVRHGSPRRALGLRRIE
jgi:hypothetical protein